MSMMTMLMKTMMSVMMMMMMKTMMLAMMMMMLAMMMMMMMIMQITLCIVAVQVLTGPPEIVVSSCLAIYLAIVAGKCILGNICQ